jgi:hypothetical protein
MLNEPDLPSKMGSSAYAYAKEKFSNEAIVANLFYFYHQQGIC